MGHSQQILVNMLPLIHNLKDRTVVIFGGGNVGTRKARLFSKEAEVFVISDDFDEELREIDGNLVKSHLSNRDEIVMFLNRFDKLFLVIPATGDRKLDDLIADIARKRGALVNNVHGPTGDVVVPSIIDAYPVLVAISTRGKSPAMSKFLRKKLEPLIDRSRKMVELQADLRDEMEGREGRRELLWDVIDSPGIWENLNKDYQKAKEIALEVIEKDEK